MKWPRWIDRWLPVGSRSVLFGAHQFALHPVILFISWWKLYGFPKDPRLYFAFVFHDIGYWHKRNMDGVDGETHPELGARIMRFLFDWKYEYRELDAYDLDVCREAGRNGWRHKGWRGDKYYVKRRVKDWHDFTLFHSRFYARRYHAQISRLCVADKMAIVLTPTWLYIPMASFTGELKEYMRLADSDRGEQEGRYVSIRIYDPDPRKWFANVKIYLRAWIEAHRDGSPDLWTPEPKREITQESKRSKKQGV